MPVSVSNWANAADLEVIRVSRLPTTGVSQQHVVGRDEWRGGGINIAPRLDFRLGDEDTLQWQTFIQRNESDNRSWRDTSALLGPPPFSVADASVSRVLWEMARSQAAVRIASVL